MTGFSEPKDIKMLQPLTRFSQPENLNNCKTRKQRFLNLKI